MTFIQARNYTPARRRPGDILWIVWHSMEAPEGPNTAENVAGWFAGPTAPQASAHVCVDQDSAVDTVRLEDIAWCAPNANAEGVHIEQAGYARQSRAEWLDPPSQATIRNACAWIRRQPMLAHIPPRFLTDDQIRRRERGHIQHRDVSRVLGGGDHTDCGPNFPTDFVVAVLTESTPKPPTPDLEDDDMPDRIITPPPGVNGPWLWIRGQHTITLDGDAGKFAAGLGVKPVQCPGADAWKQITGMR